jgi:NADH:ubiquinone oxidoreductase subunit 6 (subunit J)
MARLDFAGAFFAALVLLTLGSAAVVAFARNVIHSTVALLGTLIGVGGLYLLLAADFLAALQLFVYAGGTLVVLLVAALLTVRTDRASSSNAPLPGRAARYAVLLLVGALTTIAIDTVWPVQERALVPSTAKLGHALLGEYLIPFELASLVLVAAMIGAFTVARREPE